MNRRDFLKTGSSLAICNGLPLGKLSGLDGYLERPEPAYRWEKRGVKTVPLGTIHDLHLVSQTWHDIVWEHRLQLFLPNAVDNPDACLLYNTGGNGSTGEELIGMAWADRIGSPVAFLYGIPKQPLFGGLKEDALIVHTWKEYLESGDETWLLQFPMVKSVRKAMDAVQAFSKSENYPEINRFVITGASKRGWTAWLTGASQDKRLIGIAPMVIDMLNLHAQTKHQREVYGTFSEQVDDYTKAGIQQVFDSPQGKRLLELVDPYSYRERLTLPKLIINGTNDRYWSQDGLNLYWEGLKGQKHILYVPNSGHGLEDRGRVYATLAAFTRSVIHNKPLPKLAWKFIPNANGTGLVVIADPTMHKSRVWRVNAPTQDFREGKWTEVTQFNAVEKVDMAIANPQTGCSAFFCEAEFLDDAKKPYTLSTQLAILKAK